MILMKVCHLSCGALWPQSGNSIVIPRIFQIFIKETYLQSTGCEGVVRIERNSNGFLSWSYVNTVTSLWVP
jgi:hypothetical protein